MIEVRTEAQLDKALARTHNGADELIICLGGGRFVAGGTRPLRRGGTRPREAMTPERVTLTVCLECGAVSAERKSGDASWSQACVNADGRHGPTQDREYTSVPEDVEPVCTCAHTGECRVAMSGPTCQNPDCPPCQTPELDRDPACPVHGAEASMQDVNTRSREYVPVRCICDPPYRDEKGHEVFGKRRLPCSFPKGGKRWVSA